MTSESSREFCPYCSETEKEIYCLKDEIEALKCELASTKEKLEDSEQRNRQTSDLLTSLSQLLQISLATVNVAKRSVSPPRSVVRNRSASSSDVATSPTLRPEATETEFGEFGDPNSSEVPDHRSETESGYNETVTEYELNTEKDCGANHIDEPVTRDYEVFELESNCSRDCLEEETSQIPEEDSCNRKMGFPVCLHDELKQAILKKADEHRTREAKALNVSEREVAPHFLTNDQPPAPVQESKVLITNLEEKCSRNQKSYESRRMDFLSSMNNCANRMNLTSLLASTAAQTAMHMNQCEDHFGSESESETELETSAGCSE